MNILIGMCLSLFLVSCGDYKNMEIRHDAMSGNVAPSSPLVSYTCQDIDTDRVFKVTDYDSVARTAREVNISSSSVTANYSNILDKVEVIEGRVVIYFITNIPTIFCK